MAIGRLSVGIGKKGRARKHAEYILRLGKYEPKPLEKQTKSDKNLEDIIGSSWGNMPAWATDDPLYFFQCADEFERKNGSTYREHVISLPRELTDEQNFMLIEHWIEQELGENHAWAVAIHKPKALDGHDQPHAHLMFSDRLLDGIERDPEQYFKRYNSTSPERGGAKKSRTGMKPSEMKTELREQRGRWELLCNEHLADAGVDSRISMQSLKKQGIDRAPINLHMSEIQQPKTKQLYQAQLLAKRELEIAQIDLAIAIPNIRAELQRQRSIPRPMPPTEQPIIEDNEETRKLADEWIVAEFGRSIETILDMRERTLTDDELEQKQRALWIAEQVQEKDITDELRAQSLEYAREQQRLAQQPTDAHSSGEISPLANSPTKSVTPNPRSKIKPR